MTKEAIDTLVRDAHATLNAQFDRLKEKADELEEELAYAHAQREDAEQREQALAAHVELIDHPATVFIENAQEVIELLESAGDAPNIVAVREDLTKAADELAKILNSAPTSSLAHLKAQWQAEGVHRAVCILESEFDPCHPIIERLEQIEAEERRQAEGEQP